MLNVTTDTLIINTSIPKLSLKLTLYNLLVQWISFICASQDCWDQILGEEGSFPFLWRVRCEMISYLNSPVIVVALPGRLDLSILLSFFVILWIIYFNECSLSSFTNNNDDAKELKHTFPSFIMYPQDNCCKSRGVWIIGNCWVISVAFILSKDNIFQCYRKHRLEKLKFEK